MLNTASLALLVAVAAKLGSAAPSTTCPAWFDTFGENLLTRIPDIPGVQLSLWSPKCNLHCRDTWVSPHENYTANPPLLIDTPYRLASVTKPFTATTVLKLIEDGLVEVNASVTNYLPDWAVATLERQQGAENASQITPWMLMHHTAGLTSHPDHPEYLAMFLQNPDTYLSHRDLLEWAADHGKPRGPPGGDFWYSDTGFAYLGALIEHMTGDSLGVAVRKAARLDGLCMRSTYWEDMEEVPPGVKPRAGQYFGPIDTTNIDASHGLYGGAGLVSLSEDLIKFVRAFHRGDLLGEEAMAMARTTVPMDEQSGYGCGWMTELMSGQEAWYHEGAWGTWMYYLPGLDLAIAGALNQGSQAGRVPQIIRDVVQQVLDWGCVA